MTSIVSGFVPAPARLASVRLHDTTVSGFTPARAHLTSVSLCDAHDTDTTTRLHAHQQSNENKSSNASDTSSSFDRRSVLSTLAATATAITMSPLSAIAASPTILLDESSEAVDGIPAITRSTLGTSIRRATVRSAQVADKLDEKWERFSDSLRDENKCDPITGRRLFDNGFRKDGTRIGNPVLGDLCVPEPLLPLNDAVAELVLGSAEEEVVAMLGNSNKDAVRRKVSDIDNLVGASFARANKSTDTDQNTAKRLAYNRIVYSRMRAYGELITSNRDVKSAKAVAAEFELRWGQRLLFDAANSLIPARLANRNSFKSPFPSLTDDDKVDLAYEEGALLDGLGTVSAALDVLQGGGIIGHWEISIPTDDYGEVVTIAVDDDISLGAQALLREGRGGVALNGSVVTAITRAALKRFGITVAVDAFFLDPSTTRQDVFDPSQLLLNLSNIKGS